MEETKCRQFCWTPCNSKHWLYFYWQYLVLAVLKVLKKCGPGSESVDWTGVECSKLRGLGKFTVFAGAWFYSVLTLYKVSSNWNHRHQSCGDWRQTMWTRGLFFVFLMSWQQANLGLKDIKRETRAMEKFPLSVGSGQWSLPRPLLATDQVPDIRDFRQERLDTTQGPDPGIGY